MNDKKKPLIRFSGFTDDWEQRKVSKVAQMYDNLRVPVTASDRISGETPYYGANGIQDYVEGFTHYGEFVLVAEDGANDLINYPVQYVSGKVWVNNHAHVLQGHANTLDNLFLAVRIGSMNISSYLVGGGRAKLNGDMLKKLPIVIPTYDEQVKIGELFKRLDNAITLHQKELERMKTVKSGFLQKIFDQSVRFDGFTDAWEQRELGSEFKKVNERNDGSFGKEHWISVAKMYFQDPDKVQSNNVDTRTYVMREGDIAFEGHPNAEFKFGRFVANDIGNGVVSELFPIYRHTQEYDNNYWKHAIQLERIMAPIFAKSITSSGNSSNKLDPKHFLRQNIYIATHKEQQKIGNFFKQIDNAITLHQKKIEKLQELKKAYLQKMFI